MSPAHFWFGAGAVKSRSNRLGAMVKRWLLSVVALYLRVLTHSKAILAHQTADAPVTDLQADLLQLFGHARPAVTAKTQTMLLANMSQQNQVIALTLTDRPSAPGTVSTRCNTQDPAQAINRGRCGGVLQ